MSERETRLGQMLQRDVVTGRQRIEWATARQLGRRVSLCLWGSHADAATNCDPDEVVVRVRVQIERVGR